MIEQAILDFLVNAAWQVPLLAAGAAILLRLARPGPAWRCRIGSGFLLLALLLPADLPSAWPQRGQSAVETVRLGRSNVLPSSEAAPNLPLLGATLPPSSDSAAPLDSDRGDLAVAPATASLLTGLYLIFVGLALARLLMKLLTARRLKRGSRATALPDRLEAAVHRFADRHRMALPDIRTSGAVSSPAMVGLGRPAILVPEDFVHYGETEATTALLHEYAHIVRRDYGFNLLCELLALPLIWHPAIHLILIGISNSREMACDALAAEQMGDPTGYARSLVALARKAVGAKPIFAGAQPLLGRASLASRVDAVMRTAGPRRWTFVRTASALPLFPAILAPAAMLHFTPSIAPSSSASLPGREANEPQPPIAAAAHLPARKANRFPVRAAQAGPKIVVASSSMPPSALSIATPQNLPAPVRPTDESSETAAMAAAPAATDTVAGAETFPASQTAKLHASEGQAYSNADLRRLGYNGIGADEIAAFERAGYSKLSASDLIRLHYDGVSGGFVGVLGAAGFPPFSPQELLTLYFQGVSPSEIAAFGRIGHSTLSARDLVSLHDVGVTPGFADRLHGLGYDNLSAATVKRIFWTGILPRSPHRLNVQ
jgi:beta-lactamase regulating signal transducer with metallopeptidase domain